MPYVIFYTQILTYVHLIEKHINLIVCLKLMCGSRKDVCIVLVTVLVLKILVGNLDGFISKFLNISRELIVFVALVNILKCIRLFGIRLNPSRNILYLAQKPGTYCHTMLCVTYSWFALFPIWNFPVQVCPFLKHESISDTKNWGASFPSWQ